MAKRLTFATTLQEPSQRRPEFPPAIPNIWPVFSNIRPNQWNFAIKLVLQAQVPGNAKFSSFFGYLISLVFSVR
jgi:hypothetical protein